MANKFKVPSIDSARVKAMFADVNERAKTAREQVETRRDELVQFNKDNVDAIKASGKILAAGAKPLANEAVTNTRRQLGGLTETVKSFKGKSAAELLKLNREAAKSTFASARADTKSFGESFAKLAGEAVQPIKGRVAVVTKREQVAA
jgi:hypothetical protein